MRRSIRISILSLGLAIFVSPVMAQAQQMREVPVAIASTSFATVAPRLAKEMGFFAKQGIEPKFTTMDNANAAMTALIAKSVSLAVAGPGEQIAAQSRGQKVVSLTSTYRGFSGTLVLAKSVTDGLKVRPDAPVADRIKALDGILLGLPSATGAYTVTARTAVEATGGAIRPTYMSQPAMLAAMETGAIQGFVGGAPFWAVPVLKGAGVIWLNGPKGEFPAANSPAIIASVFATKEFVDANPDVVKAFVAAGADLAAAIDNRPQDVKVALAKLYPDLKADMLDLLFANEALALKGGAVTKDDVIRDIAYMKLSGIALPNLDSIDPASLVLP